MKKLLVKTHTDQVIQKTKQLQIQVVENPSPLAIIESTRDEEQALKLAKNKPELFVKCLNWKIIPLENLIVKTRNKTQLIAVVNSVKEARVALQAMELGVDGILLETETVNELTQVHELLQNLANKNSISIEEATVKKIQPLGLGARSCIDTCTIMEKNQGMLVGCSSQGLLLIEAEVNENKLVNTRPFRVNAGAVSLYLLGKDNKTQYLQEIQAGNEIVIVDKKGVMQTAQIARNKIEIRPLVLVEVVSEQGEIAKAILQNAETIRLIGNQASQPVTELKVGDKILAHFEKGGRHMGLLLKEETIVEK